MVNNAKYQHYSVKDQYQWTKTSFSRSKDDNIGKQSLSTEALNALDELQHNPDTLHAAILPQWKGIYKGLLAHKKFVVVDEMHVYEGAFGAHMSLVLSRFYGYAALPNAHQKHRRNWLYQFLLAVLQRYVILRNILDCSVPYH